MVSKKEFMAGFYKSGEFYGRMRATGMRAGVGDVATRLTGLRREEKAEALELFACGVVDGFTMNYDGRARICKPLCTVGSGDYALCGMCSFFGGVGCKVYESTGSRFEDVPSDGGGCV